MTKTQIESSNSFLTASQLVGRRRLWKGKVKTVIKVLKMYSAINTKKVTDIPGRQEPNYKRETDSDQQHQIVSHLHVSRPVICDKQHLTRPRNSPIAECAHCAAYWCHIRLPEDNGFRLQHSSVAADGYRPWRIVVLLLMVQTFLRCYVNY